MKGKHGSSAAVRHVLAEGDAKEAAYRRQIVRLTQERDEARRERDEARTAWKAEVRVLNAHLAEGASPRVEALTGELEKFRQRCDRMLRAAREMKDRRTREIGRLVRHFEVEHGMPPIEAIETVTKIFGQRVTDGDAADEPDALVYAQGIGGGISDLSAVKRIQAARGQRRPSDKWEPQ